ncbi:MAG: SMP-30/gluconolactonase/LRE family protein [Devosia sp.]
MQNNVAADGSPQPIERSTGALFCVQHNRTVSRHTPFNIGASNTMAWSPDDRTFYFADSLRNVIFAYPWDGEAGTIGEPRVFLEGFDRGIPDGSCIDSAGCLWNARWGGGCIVRITPRGQIDRVLEVPVTQPTNCAFAADGTLIVTSARFALSPDVVAGNPLEGAVLLVESNAQGLPENTFGG